MYDSNAISENIYKLREERKLTLGDFAQRIGMTPQGVSGFEKEKSKPSVDTLIKIAEEFKVSVDWLLSKGEQFNVSGNTVHLSGTTQGAGSLAGAGVNQAQAPTHAPQGLDLIATFEKEIECLKRSLEDRDRIIAEKDRTIAEKENTNHTLNRMITMLENQLNNKQ